jgi:hypothetical protein
MMYFHCAFMNRDFLIITTFHYSDAYCVIIECQLSFKNIIINITYCTLLMDEITKFTLHVMSHRFLSEKIIISCKDFFSSYIVCSNSHYSFTNQCKSSFISKMCETCESNCDSSQGDIFFGLFSL